MANEQISEAEPEAEETESESELFRETEGADESTNWFIGFESNLGITVSSKMAQKLKKERQALQRKMKLLAKDALKKTNMAD